MAQMKKDLRLSEEPRHIECFDNSNIQGTNPVAACVVFKNGKPSKKDYPHSLFPVRKRIPGMTVVTRRLVFSFFFSQFLSLLQLLKIFYNFFCPAYAHYFFQIIKTGFTNTFGALKMFQ